MCTSSLTVKSLRLATSAVSSSKSCSDEVLDLRIRQVDIDGRQVTGAVKTVVDQTDSVELVPVLGMMMVLCLLEAKMKILSA